MYKKLFVTFVVLLLMMPLLPVKSHAEANSEFRSFQLIQGLEVKIDSANDPLVLNEGFIFFSKGMDEQDQIRINLLGEVVELDHHSVREYKGDHLPNLIDEKSVIKTMELLYEISAYEKLEGEKEIAILPKGASLHIISENKDTYSVLLGQREVLVFKKDLQPSEVDQTEAENSQSDETNLEEESTTESKEETIEDDRVTESKEVIIEEDRTKEGTEAKPAEKPAKESSEKQPEETAKKHDREQVTTSSIKKASVAGYGFEKHFKYFQAAKHNISVYDNRSGKLERVGTLEKGQVYPRVSDYGDWHRIRFGSFYGYVHKSGTKTAKNEVSNRNKGQKNSTKYVTLGRDSSVYDNSSGKLKKFATIEKSVRYPVISDYGNWYKIDLSGRIGFIHKDNLAKQTASAPKYFEVRVNNLNVYDNSGKSLKSVGLLKKGQRFPIVSNYGDWYRVSFNGKYAYVWKGSTRLVSTIKKSPISKSFNTINIKVEVFDQVPVYDNSTDKLVQFAVIQPGQKFNVLKDYGHWWRVNVAGRIGYIHKTRVDPVFSKNAKYFKVYLPKASVYDNRSGKLVKVGELKANTTYERVRDYGRWHEIEFGGHVAYVRKNNTQPSSKGAAHYNSGGLKNSSKSFVTDKAVLIYAKDGESLQSIAKLQKGISYPIISEYGKWWRVDLSGRIGYVRKSHVSTGKASYTDSTIYQYSLEEAVDKQMKVNPQTDKYTGEKAYISADYVDANPNGEFPQVGEITATVLNIRDARSNDSHVYGQFKRNTSVKLIDYQDGWYELELPYGWYNAKRSDVEYYLNPANLNIEGTDAYQFLVLSKSTNIHVSELEKILAGKGILDGKGQAFVDASTKYYINEIYLISHALLETGNGGSSLSTGVTVNGRTVYNMYGIGAYDNCALQCGSDFAYKEGWFTPEAAIIGGAKFVADGYIHNEHYKQDTLYKMRWNPEAPATHQYATDIGWASKQVYSMSRLYDMIQNYTVYYDLPVYK